MPGRKLLCLCKFMHYHQCHRCHPPVLNVSANVRYPVIPSALFFCLFPFSVLDDYTHIFIAPKVTHVTCCWIAWEPFNACCNHHAFPQQ